MDTPTYNSEGELVWKPQPGEYWPPGLQFRESYGGIIAAFNDIGVAEGKVPKAYPQNFAGIIAAIEELEQFLVEGEKPDVGAPPPGWEIIVNPDGSIDGDWVEEPPEGNLWFDTRQGRLFIAIDGEYVQTNGGDGIAHVGEDPPTNPPVVGQQWMDSSNGVFYVYIGNGVWRAVVSDGDITITTATLPLAVNRSEPEGFAPMALPEIDPNNMKVQKDYNNWLFAALQTLDTAVAEGSVNISDTPPTVNVVPGTLWYDSNTLELSIYYVDDDSSQWVPVSTGYTEQALAPFNQRLDEEVANRKVAVKNVLNLIAANDSADRQSVMLLEQAATALSQRVNTLESVPALDLAPYARTSSLLPLISRIESLEDAPGPDFTPYATNTAVAALQNQVNNLDLLQLSDVTPLIPDVSSKVEQSDIDSSIAAITNSFLPRNGGTINGHFVVNKDDISTPAFDVSSSWSNSENLFKLRSYSPDNATSTFGATDQFWQYAWEFAGHEDFAWVHDGNKVFSITEDGPACSAMYIGQFIGNDESGRRMLNTIEVGEQLRLYETKFAAIRQAVSQSNDYASLKSALLSALPNS